MEMFILLCLVKLLRLVSYVFFAVRDLKACHIACNNRSQALQVPSLSLLCIPP